jgi:hypothetical protein
MTTQMTPGTTPGTGPSAVGSPPPVAGRRRRIAARVWAAVLLAMLVAPTAPLLVTGWTSSLDHGTHVVHDLAHVSHTALLIGPALVAVLLGLGRATGLSTVLAAFVLPLPVAVLGGLMTAAEAVVPVVGIAVLVALHPDRGRMLKGARPNPLLLAMTAVAAVPLAVYGARQLDLQATLPVTEPHAAVGHWAGMAFWALALVCLAALTSLRVPVWRLPLYSGAAAVALVATASLVHPAMPSSLGTTGALAAVAGTAAFVLVAERAARRTAR